MTDAPRTSRAAPLGLFAARVAHGASRARAIGAALLASVAMAAASGPASAQLIAKEKPPVLDGVDVVERLGESVPTRLTFTDASGETVSLGDYFDGDKPVVIAPVYFGCPVVCPLILERLTNSFRDLDYTIGEDFNVIVFSIDHTEGPTESWGAKVRYTDAYNRADTPQREAAIEAGWAFLTGDEQAVRALADAAGWHYKRLDNGEYSHPTAVMVASPEGEITRYIYGFDFPPKQMKLSLLDATEGKIAKSLGEKLLHYCYRFDPAAGAYSMEAMAVMRVAGVLTVIGIAGLIGTLLVLERAKKKIAAGRREARNADHVADAGPRHAPASA